MFRAGGWACGHVADGHAWMHLRADVNGCKQKEKRKGERKEKKEGLTAGSGHERVVRTLPNKDKLFEQCSNSTPPHGGLFKHCSNAWKVYIACLNSVRTLFKCMEREYNMSEHCLKCSNIAKQGQTVRIVFEQHMVPLHGRLFKHCLDSTQSSAWCYLSLSVSPYPCLVPSCHSFPLSTLYLSSPYLTLSYPYTSCPYTYDYTLTILSRSPHLWYYLV